MSSLLQGWRQEIEACESLVGLDGIRVRLLGKNGQLTEMLKELGGLDPESRKTKGAEINALKTAVLDVLESRKDVLTHEALRQRLETERLDMTLPVRPQSLGRLHPITQTIDDVVAYFAHLGFVVAKGPDIEDDEHNFNALNIPDHHPARQSHDTFYFNEPGWLLRTHTSPVQIRTMRGQEPPIRILVPGRAYRCDYDATHTPMFHQFEGLVIDKATHFGHLKGTLIDFCRWFFEKSDLKVRLRPSFFPFTEPSAEVDIGWKDGKWLEILGCGMVHPQVLRNCNIDPDVYQGFAFGMGIERIAMLKYGITDIRDLYAGDLRWMSQFGHYPWGGAK